MAKLTTQPQPKTTYISSLLGNSSIPNFMPTQTSKANTAGIKIGALSPAQKAAPKPVITPANTSATKPKSAPIVAPTKSSQGGASTGYVDYLLGNQYSAPYESGYSLPQEQPKMTPQTSARDEFINAYKAYQQTQTDNADISSAKQTYNDFVANLAKSKAGMEGQGRGIPLQIVRGQQEKLLNQNQPEALRLQGDVNIAQDAYDQRVGAAKSGVELYKSLMEADTDANKPFNLGKDESRYDASGKLLARGVGTSAAADSNELLSPTEAQLLGVPYGTTKGQAFGASPTSKPTEEQSKARQFAVSAENANNLLASLGYNIGAIQLPLPNQLKTPARQQFEQAARAFVNSVLRRESGATITDSEFQNKYAELIDKAGDSAAVKQQKANARAAAVQSIKQAGGNMGQGGSTGNSIYNF